MKSIVLKAAVVTGLVSASAAAFAARGCCGDVTCCLMNLLECCWS